jgi:hypothetical protein
VGTFNLSYESLTSHEAQKVLQDLPATQPAFFAELTNLCRRQILVLNDNKVIEEDDDTDDDTEEDLEVLLAVLLDRIHNPMRESNRYETDDDGRLVSTAEAECAFAEESGEVSTEQAEEEKGRGKQKKVANTLYAEDAFRWWQKD